MMMTVRETPKETRVSIYNERSAKSTGRIKGKQPGERSPQSISRTKSKVRDIVTCNEFDLAVTLEINPRKVPISKQEDTLQEIIDYFKSIKRTHKNFRWLLVPEKYPSGKRLHLHGLLKNFPAELLQPFSKRKGRKPNYVHRLWAESWDVYTIPTYNMQYGYSMVTTCDMMTSSSKFVGRDYWADYIVKSLGETAKIRPVGKQLVYVSQGLDRPKVVEKATVSTQGEKKIAKVANKSYMHIIIGDGRAAEQIPHDAQGRFIMEDGTVFQAYYFNDDTISKW